MTLLLLRLEAATGRKVWRLALLPLFLLWAKVVLGQLLDAFGRSAEGAKWLRQAVELGPESTDARLMLAGALRTLERAARLEPSSYLVHYRLGDLYFQQGKGVQAEYHFRRALQSRPGDPAARRRLEALRQRTKP